MNAYRLTAASALAVATTVAGLLSVASPAMANDASFTVTPGPISIATPTTAVALGTSASALTAGKVSGALGTVTVSDARGSGYPTWTASVSSTDFTITGLTAVPASAVDYNAGTITPSGSGATGASFFSGLVTNISAPKAGVTASALSGNNSVTWNPTVIVNIPANASVGTYTGTITQSVA